MPRRKDPAAVALGRRGGLKGGPARAAKLTQEERRASARKAIRARWEKARRPNPLSISQDAREGKAAFDSATKVDVGQGAYQILLADCLAWMKERQKNSIHAIVTDPPYGLLEFTEEQKTKLRAGRGGVWRIPPSFDGSKRSPLPRFTVLSPADHEELVRFFTEWATLAYRVLVPGGHVFLATNPLLSDLVSSALRATGLEKRGEIIRIVQTLRGGDRPKNAHLEFDEVTVMPRSCYEPWVVFRKPVEGRVQDNLRKWSAGALRRISSNQPFRDLILSSPTRAEERVLANHPALKPQAFMRRIVRAALPLGQGVVLDPFMGGGSTIAAAVANGYESVGLEKDLEYFRLAEQGIPKLASVVTENREQMNFAGF